VAIRSQDRYVHSVCNPPNTAHFVETRNRTSLAPPIPVIQETHRDERATMIPTTMVDVKEQLSMHPERVRLLIDRKMVSGKWLPRTDGLCVDNFPPVTDEYESGNGSSGKTQGGGSYGYVFERGA
jgi:hypothetical protein